MLKGIKKLTLGVAVIALLATTTLWSAPAQASEPFIGQIMIVGFNFAPRGFASCDGQLLPISQNTALFSLLGTTFGGDGRTTFGLPDLRGRTAVGVGTGPGISTMSWGEKAGVENTLLTVANLPSHSHSVSVKGTATRGNSEIPTGNTWASRSRDNDYSNATPVVEMKAGSVSIGNTGNGTSFTNMQPSLGLWHVIALVGIYPSRS